MQKTLLIKTAIALLMSAASTGSATSETKIQQTDKYGNVLHHLPSYTIQDNGRIVETDKFGNKQLHKDQWQIQGDKIKPVDKYGNLQPKRSTRQLIPLTTASRLNYSPLKHCCPRLWPMSRTP